MKSTIITLLGLTTLVVACHLEELPDIGASLLPQAAFTANPENCEFSCTVTFTNDSENAETYQWTFGDGTSSTERVPAPHLYDQLGTYIVRLVARNVMGDSSIATRTISVIDPNEPPIAGFNTSRNNCFADNCSISFTNTSENAVRFEWDFGDGSPISTLTNPTHSYDSPDTYTITLRAFNASDEVNEISFQLPVLSRQFELAPNNLGPGRRVLQLPSGDYLIVGNQVTGGGSDSDIYITVIDTAGVTQPNYPINFGTSNGFDEARDAILLGNGNVLVTGVTKNSNGFDSDLFYLNFNPANPLTASPIEIGEDGRDENGYGLIETFEFGESRTVILGDVFNNNNFTSDYFFKKIQTNGGANIVEDTDTNGGNVFLYDGVLAANGNFWLVGETDTAIPGAKSNGYTLVVNNDGKIIKELPLSNNNSQVWNSILDLADNTAILTGKTEVSGNPEVWIGEVDLSSNNFTNSNTRTLGVGTGQMIRKTPNGFALVGSQNNKCLLLLLDNTANIITNGSKTYGSAASNEFRDVTATRDGGFIAVGEQGGKLYIIKTDQFGDAF